jgi:hypothetical protein
MLYKDHDMFCNSCFRKGKLSLVKHDWHWAECTVCKLTYYLDHSFITKEDVMIFIEENVPKYNNWLKKFK